VCQDIEGERNQVFNSNKAGWDKGSGKPCEGEDGTGEERARLKTLIKQGAGPTDGT